MKNLNLTDQQRIARAKVRMKLVRKKNELRDLEEDYKTGKAEKSDLDTCRGEIEVLKKEIESIEQSGHTVFLNAKEMLAPKKDLAEKKKKLSNRKLILERKIRITQKQIDNTDTPEDQKEILKSQLENINADLDSLLEEEQSLGSYNHTRFLESRKMNEKFEGQEGKKKDLEKKISTTEEEIKEAESRNDNDYVETLSEQLHLFRMELEAIENFTHDEFLENLKSLKAKRKSDLA